MMARELKLITGLVELDRTSLRERALEMLRKAVTAREIEPGSRLVETELSAAMGISRGTLREALRQLEYEGLIEVGERGRLTVRTLTDCGARGHVHRPRRPGGVGRRRSQYPARP